MCGVYYSIMRTTHPDLVCLLLCHPYIPLSNLKNFHLLVILYYMGGCLCYTCTCHFILHSWKPYKPHFLIGKRRNLVEASYETSGKNSSCLVKVIMSKESAVTAIKKGDLFELCHILGGVRVGY